MSEHRCESCLNHYDEGDEGTVSLCAGCNEEGDGGERRQRQDAEISRLKAALAAAEGKRKVDLAELSRLRDVLAVAFDKARRFSHRVIRWVDDAGHQHECVLTAAGVRSKVRGLRSEDGVTGITVWRVYSKPRPVAR